MANIDEYVKANDGKEIDVDGAHGPQCWDLAQHWVTANGGGALSTQAPKHTGYAGACWYAPQPGMTKHVSNPQSGDLVVWGVGPMTPLTHIAIYLRPSKNPTMMTVFSANSPQRAARVQDITKIGVYGYLRMGGVSGGGDVKGESRLKDLNPLDGFDISGITDVVKALRSPEFWKRAGLIFGGAVLLLIVLLSVMGKTMTDVPIVNEVI